MSLNRNSLLAIAAGMLAISLSGCGTHPMLVNARALAVNSGVQAQGVPPSSAFVTLDATVTEILPADTSGLPHQNFIVDVKGQKFTVNNDTQYGTEVAGLVVGMHLTIRGVEYHNPGKDGIHWTHHADKDNDAGFIRTADGHTYQ